VVNENFKPAKHNPASLQARAVIIMCELSNECTKLGGNALFCFLTDTWNTIIITKLVQKENKSGI